MGKVTSNVACQAACVNATGCTTFTFFEDFGNCFLGGILSNIQWDPKATSGPRECQASPPACTAILPTNFPGNTAQATLDVMSSSTGLVPPKLQCWPRGADNAFLPCKAD